MFQFLQKTPILQQGFTLIEVSIVLALMGMMVGMSVVSLTPLIPRGNLTTSVNNLVSDLALQQHQAMTGEGTSAGVRPAYGVYFQEDRYILFEGIRYSTASASNVVIELPENVKLTTINLPNNSVVYATVSGEVQNFNSSQNTILVTSTVVSDQSTITINQLGVATSL